MTRKLLILLLPIVLSACNLLGSTTNSDNLPEHDLTTDYSRAMNRVFSVTYDTKLKNFLDGVYQKFAPPGYDTGSLQVFYNSPKVGKMDLTLHADAVRESWRKMSANMSLTGSIESPDTNIRFNDVRGGYISLFPAKTFIRLDAFDIVGSLNETIKKSLKGSRLKLGTWYLSDGIHIPQNLVDGEIGSFFVPFIARLIDDVLDNGLVHIRRTFASHPILESISGTGNLVNSNYEYDVRYSASGAEDLFLTLVDIYTDTGSITPSIRSTIHELTQSINGKGTFRIDKLDPSIFHFTGRFFTLKRMYDLAIDVEKNHTFYELTGKYWGFTSTFDRFPNNRVLYSLEMKDGTGSTEWIHYEGKTSSKGLYLTLRVGDIETRALQIQYANTANTFSGSIEMLPVDQNAIFLSYSGKREGGVLTRIGGHIEQGNTNIDGDVLLDGDENFTGTLTTPVGVFHALDHIHTGDIFIKGESQGLTATLVQTYTNAGLLDGKLELPVGSLSWTGKILDGTISGFHSAFVSPFGHVSVNLDQTSQGLVAGPFIIADEKNEILSGKLLLHIEPKKRGLRIDTTNPIDGTPLSFGIETISDILWSESAHVDIPKDYFPIADLLGTGGMDGVNSLPGLSGF